MRSHIGQFAKLMRLRVKLTSLVRISRRLSLRSLLFKVVGLSDLLRVLLTVARCVHRDQWRNDTGFSTQCGGRSTGRKNSKCEGKTFNTTSDRAIDQTALHVAWNIAGKHVLKCVASIDALPQSFRRLRERWSTGGESLLRCLVSGSGVDGQPGSATGKVASQTLALNAALVLLLKDFLTNGFPLKVSHTLLREARIFIVCIIDQFLRLLCLSLTSSDNIWTVLAITLCSFFDLLLRILKHLLLRLDLDIILLHASLHIIIAKLWELDFERRKVNLLAAFLQIGDLVSEPESGGRGNAMAHAIKLLLLGGDHVVQGLLGFRFTTGKLHHRSRTITRVNGIVVSYGSITTVDRSATGGVSSCFRKIEDIGLQDSVETLCKTLPVFPWSVVTIGDHFVRIEVGGLVSLPERLSLFGCVLEKVLTVALDFELPRFPKGPHGLVIELADGAQLGVMVMTLCTEEQLGVVVAPRLHGFCCFLRGEAVLLSSCEDVLKLRIENIALKCGVHVTSC